MPVSSSTEHWIKPDALTINLNHFGDPDYLQVSVLAGAVVMAFKQDVIGYNAAHNYRTWPLDAANTYLETTSAYNVYARLTRSEVNARALVVYDTVIRDIEGRGITYKVDEETGEEVEEFGEPDETSYFIFLGQISASVNETGSCLTREWLSELRFGSLNTSQYQNEEAGGEWTKMFRLNKVTDLIETLKIVSSAIFKKYSIKRGEIEKPVTDLKRSIDSDDEFFLDEDKNPQVDEEGNPIPNPNYVPVSDETIPSTLYMENATLSKRKEDQTEFLLKLLGGAHVGEAVDSMIAGKGTVMTNDGRIQTDRLEVRGSALFNELIFNRLSAQEGDTSYSENGLVEEAVRMEDGTYTLYLQKRWDNDFTAFKEHDILYGTVNNLFSTGEYYTSWVRVLSVDLAANSVSVVMYGDSEVPGGVNFAPEKQMRLVRRGNAVDTTRQSYWYLSATTEKCLVWLEGVDKPVIETYNYYVILGRLPEGIRPLFVNLPIDYEHSYVYARGAIIQDFHRVNFEGKPIKQLNDRGQWSLEVAESENPYVNESEVADTVYHYGCRWQCLVTGTLQEPKYSSSDWAMIEGNPEFTIDVNSTNNYYFDMDVISQTNELGEYSVFTTLVVTGKLYNQDVTDSILDADCSWTRYTGNVTEDNAWAVKRASAGKELPLTVDDLGSEYSTMRSCTFKVTVLLRDGQADEYEITF